MIGESAALPAQPPFHLEATVRVLQRRPSNRVDVWEQGRYRRLLPLPDGLVLVEVENGGTIDAPAVRCSVLTGTTSAGAAAVADNVRRILGLDVDPGLLQHLASVEPRLTATVTALRGMRPPCFVSLFEAFAGVIPFQQLSIDAGVAIVGRLVRQFGRYLEHGGHRYYAFPAAATVAGSDPARLRSCGLSTRKAQTLQRLAASIDSGELSAARLESMSTPEAGKALMSLTGVGPWTAGLVLLRGFGRIDVFPPGDVGAARGLKTLLHLDAGTRVDDIVGRFGDQRGYLYFCSLGADLLERGLIGPAPEPAAHECRRWHA